MASEKTLVYGTDGEMFNIEEKEEVEDQSCYYVGERKDILPEELLWRTTDTIVEEMEERLYDHVGEAADGGLTLSAEHRKELDSIIKDFMNKHVNITCYAVCNVHKVVNGEIQDETN